MLHTAKWIGTQASSKVLLDHLSHCIWFHSNYATAGIFFYKGRLNYAWTFLLFLSHFAKKLRNQSTVNNIQFRYYRSVFLLLKNLFDCLQKAVLDFEKKLVISSWNVAQCISSLWINEWNYFKTITYVMTFWGHRR